MSSIGDSLLQLRGVAPQLAVLVLDPAQHLVEGVGQRTQFVFAER
jgi:hypothetical protein